MMSKPLYTYQATYFSCSFFFKCRHRCRLYTCEICTFCMFFFGEISFFYQNQHANGRNVRTYQDIHYFGSENGRHWSGKRWVFGVFQWILPPMRLYNTHVRKPQVLAREMPVRMFDSSCVTLVLLKHFDTFANSMENWEWERVIQTHMLTNRTPCGCVATSMLQFGRTTKK